MNRGSVIRACVGTAFISWSVWSATASAQTVPPRPDLWHLSPEDKAEITDILNVQTRLGDEAWPGFGRARIPIVLYDDSSQFLITETAPPPPWVIVQRDRFDGHPYYRKDKANARSFALKVGTVWAGSLSPRASMNRKLPFEVGRDVHVVAVLHEMFHAFQATQAPGRFADATAAYRSEHRYPFRDSVFASAWNREGSLLAAALRATDDRTKREAVQKFLAAREARRVRASLDPELVAFELKLEWLEGLGKYVEVELYTLAASQPGGLTTSFSSAAPDASSLLMLEHQLGSQSGDLRFYLSGMAQARLLDDLSPGWKEKAFNAPVFLEDLLRQSVPHFLQR